jgi:hypothetical protein
MELLFFTPNLLKAIVLKLFCVYFETMSPLCAQKCDTEGIFFSPIYTLRRVVLDTIGTRMTRMERMFTDFFGTQCNIREKFQKKSVNIRPIRVIRVPIVPKTIVREV